jgi:hypothetical protein
MAEPLKPTLIRLQLEHTPSPNDPEGASEFYQALGIFVMAFGRLEGHFLMCILRILQTPATMGLSKILPQALTEQARIWADAFRISAALNQHEKDALDFLKEMQDAAIDRNRFVHGLWEGFNHGVPLSADNVSIKYVKKTIDSVALRRATITIDQLAKAAQRASRLNIALLPLSTLLAVEQGPPPSNVHIF